MKRLAIRSDSGMTVLEMCFAGSIAAAVCAAGFAFVASSRSGGAAATKKSALSSRTAEVAERLARDLAVAGMHGEDANRNGRLDADEDVDRDGRLDADWTLAEATVASDFTFNVRRPDWTWSGPIRWRVDDGTLQRIESGATVEVARGVETFEVTRTGDEVTLHLVLSGPDAMGEQQSESVERRVYVRN